MAHKWRNLSDIPEKKTASVHARIRPSLKARLQAIYEEHRVGESDLVETALDALCTYIETEQRFRRPVVVVYDRETAELQKQLAAEEAAGHTAAADAIQKRLENRLRTGAKAASHSSRDARK